MRRLAAAAVFLSALIAVSAASATVPPPPLGNYAFIDGPIAGQGVYVNAAGKISLIDGSADALAFQAEADGDCDQPHVHGTIRGKPSPTGPCGWGRIVKRDKLSPLVHDIVTAVTEEERAVADLENDPPGAHWELALYGLLGVEHSLDELEKAEKAGKIDAKKARAVRNRLNAAAEIDQDVKKAWQQNRHPTDGQASRWIRKLKNALSLKREAFSIAFHSQQKSDTAPVPAPGGHSRTMLLLPSVTVFWDINVPKRVKSVLCVAKAKGKVTNNAKPVFPGSTQVQTCKATNTLKTVGGKKKRVVHFEMTIYGLQTGDDVPVKVIVFWSP